MHQDEQLNRVIKEIPQLAQRQYATDDQLTQLWRVANKLGLYDAADRLRDTLLCGGHCSRRRT